MTTLHQQLEEWVISETRLLSDKQLPFFPETPVFCRLIENKNKRIWKYIVNHVRSRPTADKLKRVLKVKRDQEEPENPYPLTNADQILKRITSAKQRRLFLENSLSDVRREIDNTENDVRKLCDEISVLNQKSAFLELITAEYKEKCASLNSIKSQLSAYVEKNSKQSTQFYLALNFPLAPTSTVRKKFGEEDATNKIKYILKQIFSLLADSKGETSLSDNLKRNVNVMVNSVSMADLFLVLKEISNDSYLELMSNETYCSIEKTHPSTLNKKNSEKYLQDMKLSLIQSSFAAKKAKKDILQLQDEKESILKTFHFKSDDIAFEKKCELLQKMSTNAGLGESIKFLEDTLNNERNEAKMLTEDTNEKTAKAVKLEFAVQNFYSNLDTLCTLLTSGPQTHEYIIKSLLRMKKFANDKMFCNVTPTLKEYPFKIKQDFIFDTETMWSVFEKNNVINPLIPCLLSMGTVVPDNFKALLNVSKFESECVVARKVRNMKNELSSNKDSEFKHDDNDFSNIHQKYIMMMEMFQKMQDKLELCNCNFREYSEHNQRAQVVLRDWWEQGAQFIPPIEYKEKSLKMWLDILHVLPEI